jgi:hypothetical protein
MATAESQLSDWFTYLKQFKICCREINSDVDHLTLLSFANSKISTLLATSNEQAQYATSCHDSTNLPVTPGAVAAAANFVGLLEATWGFPNMYVTAYLRSLSPAPFNGMKFGDFILQKVKDVFPGGAIDSNWVKIDAGLAKIIGSECYSTAQRQKVAVIVADVTKLITDVVNQISVLG